MFLAVTLDFFLGAICLQIFRLVHLHNVQWANMFCIVLHHLNCEKCMSTTGLVLLVNVCAQEKNLRYVVLYLIKCRCKINHHAIRMLTTAKIYRALVEVFPLPKAICEDSNQIPIARIN